LWDSWQTFIRILDDGEADTCFGRFARNGHRELEWRETIYIRKCRDILHSGRARRSRGLWFVFEMKWGVRGQMRGSRGVEELKGRRHAHDGSHTTLYGMDHLRTDRDADRGSI